MMKKINTFGVIVKTFLEKGYSQIWISRKLRASKQKVNYWAINPLRTKQFKRRKLEDKYIKKIIDLAKDQTTSTMSSSKITNTINSDLIPEGKKIQINKSTICRILNAEIGKPRKIKKIFFLTEKQKGERVEFCQNILKQNISGKNILFTDETGIYINDSIRLSEETKEKLKHGEKDAYKKKIDHLRNLILL